MPRPLMPVHAAALAAFAAFGALLLVRPALAPAPLALFVAVLLAAPLFPALAFYYPVAVHGDRHRPEVALTFDDGPDPEVTPRVLDLLDRHGVKAAFFVIGAKAEAHPDLIRAILDRGHEVGNHSYSHFPMLMLMGKRVLRREVEAGQGALRPFGIVPRAFRPPVGITGPALGPLLEELGLVCVNFSCRAADLGNRRVGNLAARLLGKVRGGDIVLLHDVRPRDGDVDHLLGQFEALLLGLGQKGLATRPLGALLGRNLVESQASGAPPFR